MSDIIQEIQTDIQAEKYQKIFLEHGKKLILGAVIILIAVSAKTVYHSMQKKKSLESGNLFINAFDTTGPESYDAIIAKGQKGYAPLAILMKAGLENSKDKYDDALKTLSQLENSAYDKAFKDAAQLDKAFILIQKNGDKAEIVKTLDGISGKDAPFYGTALELKANYLLAQGDTKPAVEILRQLSTDNTLPSTMQERAKQTLGMINE